MEQDDGYNAWATQQIKWVVGAFSVTCFFVAIFKDWGFGFWWLAVWAIGIFAASLLSSPFVIGEWFARRRGYDWLALLLGVVHTWGVFPAAYYLLKLLHSEIT